MTPKSLTLAVGVRIKRLRGWGRPRLEAAARKAFMLPSRLVDIENGVFSSTAETLDRLAFAAGVRATDLLNVDGSEHGAIYELLRQHPAMVKKLLIDLRR